MIPVKMISILYILLDECKLKTTAVMFYSSASQTCPGGPQPCTIMSPSSNTPDSTQLVSGDCKN